MKRPGLLSGEQENMEVVSLIKRIRMVKKYHTKLTLPGSAPLIEKTEPDIWTVRSKSLGNYI